MAEFTFESTLNNIQPSLSSYFFLLALIVIQQRLQSFRSMLYRSALEIDILVLQFQAFKFAFITNIYLLKHDIYCFVIGTHISLDKCLFCAVYILNLTDGVTVNLVSTKTWIIKRLLKHVFLELLCF